MVDTERLKSDVKFVVNKTEDTLQREAEILERDAEFILQEEKLLLRGARKKLDELEMKMLNFQVNKEVHLVFSTDCSDYQDWQTLVFFHSATMIKQQGKITRIASGCSEEQQKVLTDLYGQLYPHGLYQAHFTPDFKKDESSNVNYDFYNKPRGMQHWLSHAQPPIPDDTVIALLDPDMILLRPITAKVRGMKGILYNTKRPYGVKDEDIFTSVDVGKPVGQTYGLSAPWANDKHKKFNRKKICGADSPCMLPLEDYAAEHYSVGPPYIAHKLDFDKIVDSWTRLVPKVYESYPYLLAEMYAYSMAAAHEELPHLQLNNLMVSNVDSSNEGWQWIDSLEDACLPPNQEGIFYADKEMPTVLHMCQNYMVDSFGFEKRKVTKFNIFQCDSPMLVDPPYNIGRKQYKDLSGKEATKVKRHTFMSCTIYRVINSAILDYKTKMCHDSFATNFDRSINVKLS